MIECPYRDINMDLHGEGFFDVLKTIGKFITSAPVQSAAKAIIPEVGKVIANKIQEKGEQRASESIIEKYRGIEDPVEQKAYLESIDIPKDQLFKLYETEGNPDKRLMILELIKKKKMPSKPVNMPAPSYYQQKPPKTKNKNITQYNG